MSEEYDIPEGLLYTEEHEWARLESDGTVTVGVTDYAQKQLHDIVYVELPGVGDDDSALPVYARARSPSQAAHTGT